MQHHMQSLCITRHPRTMQRSRMEAAWTQQTAQLWQQHLPLVPWST